MSLDAASEAPAGSSADEPASEDAGDWGDGARVRRAWSPRGFPAGLVALVAAGVAGTALYIGVTARIDRAPRWSRDLLERAQTHEWRDSAVVAAGLVTAVVGLWLIVLAVTPGRRSLLRLRSPGDGMTVYMTRRTAASFLRHTALASSGVLDARVRMGRRKAVLRVDYHFRDPDELHDELTERLEERAHALTLARVPRVDLRLQPVSGR
ncbi:DUF6286 domain-containing protein [Embleya sp. NBC_00896]|uniref:DUF6286 domain-containing protein n=1 Tax=Embleya sp. NBC_00896 TaxID=2975961 RepID=UPI003868DE4C|nr:alkaline shock response membrane anchor protein AmaP [Embleya sp. NBC_00896]